MKIEIKIPSPGESISEVEISSWLVKNGDYVTKNDVIAEIDSDKATLEIVAEQSGQITIFKNETSVKVGEIVAEINTDATSDNVLKKEEKEISYENNSTIDTKSDSIKIASHHPSPAARKILAEKGINPNDVFPSGKDGRITKQDAVKARPAMGRANRTRISTSEKMSVLRRKISERLVSVKNKTAMLTTFNEVDLSEVNKLRKTYKEPFFEKYGVSLGYMSFFTLAVTKALRSFPMVGAMIDGDELVKFDFCDISIAVSSPKGLVVPVLRNTETMSFADVELEIKRLSTLARDGKLSIEEMTGGIFTITNGGVFGSMLSTPIINPPQSAILGMHNIIDRPVAISGQVEIRPMMYLALSYDHRIIDGKDSVGFLLSIKKYLENPIEELNFNF